MTLSMKFHIMLHMAACQPCTLSNLARQVHLQHCFTPEEAAVLSDVNGIFNLVGVAVGDLCARGFMCQYEGSVDAFDLTDKGWQWSELYGQKWDEGVLALEAKPEQERVVWDADGKAFYELMTRVQPPAPGHNRVGNVLVIKWRHNGALLAAVPLEHDCLDRQNVVVKYAELYDFDITKLVWQVVPLVLPLE